VFNLSGGVDGGNAPTWGTAADEYFAGYADRGEEMRFSLPEGTYRGLMFLGRVSTHKLLAVGVVTGVRGGADTVITDGVFEVTDEVRLIEFTVSPLLSNIVSDEGSSFKITSPSGYATLKDHDSEPSTPDIDYPSGETQAVDGAEVPFFNIPAKNVEDAEDGGYSNVNAILGTFSVGGFSALLAGPLFDAEDTDNPELDAWLGLDTATKQAQSIAVPAYNTRTKVNLDPVAVTPAILKVYIDDTDEALVWDFHLTTSTTPGLTDGFAKIQFYAGVKAFGPGEGSTGDKGDVWYISNGYNPGALDAGGVSVGQNILLLVGEQNVLNNPEIVVVGNDNGETIITN
jgi:hypothetical protein